MPPTRSATAPRSAMPASADAAAARVIGHAERLVRIHEIEAVVRHAGALLRGGLGGADVHAAVHLARVRGDDLGGNAPDTQFFGQRQR